jgi:hypothetical protein
MNEMLKSIQANKKPKENASDLKKKIGRNAGGVSSSTGSAL